MSRAFIGRAAVLAALIAVAGCTGERVYAPDEVILSSMYRHDGPPKLTLYTMVSNNTGSGAHSAIQINASQRVIFDPAGTFESSLIPERNDVLYGITPRIEDFYRRAHARSTYHVIIQEVEVPAAVAEQALRLAMEAGPVGSALCAQATSGLLRQLPGFEGIQSTWFPKNLSDQFGQYPGVTTERLFEDDDDDKTLEVILPAPATAG